MATANTTPPRAPNKLLSLLPANERQPLMDCLRPVDLPIRKMLYRVHAPVNTVYFPTSGVVSAVTQLNNGAAIEVATIGNEGMVGVAALFGDISAPNETYVQVAGTGLQIGITDLRRLAPPGSAIYQLCVKYLNAYLFQVSQTVACNGIHNILQRCCRWLLMTHDRVHVDDMPLTHEFLAVMLGVRRASVTDVLMPLQKEEIVTSHRGVITILDRARLEKQSCECYAAVQDEYHRLLGARSSK